MFNFNLTYLYILFDCLEWSTEFKIENQNRKRKRNRNYCFRFGLIIILCNEFTKWTYNVCYDGDSLYASRTNEVILMIGCHDCIHTRLLTLSLALNHINESDACMHIEYIVFVFSLKSETLVKIENLKQQIIAIACLHLNICIDCVYLCILQTHKHTSQHELKNFTARQATQN